MKRILAILALSALSVVGSPGAAAAAPAPCPAAFPCEGTIYLDGVLVRTILPPASTPNEGRDNFYKVPGVGGVAGVGPGDVGYHGGSWKVFLVSGNTAGLTSEAAILAAEQVGRVTITRAADQDFRCPIQP